MALAQPSAKSVVVKAVKFRADTINIAKHGAVGNGYFLNTAAVQGAIDKIAMRGGGVVLIPRGSWLTGPLSLKSNVNLHVAEGALVIFTPDFSQYPLVVSSFEGVDAARCMAPITAESCENIALTGKGIMNGNGQYWRPLKKDKQTESEWKKHLAMYGGALTEDKKTWYPSTAAVQAAAEKNIGKLAGGKKLNDFEGIKDFLRPNMVRINRCKRVLIQDITLENSPAWTTHLVLSQDVTVKGLKVKNPWFGTNTDALDLESCRDVLMKDCIFDTGDDGITIKSGRDEEGRKRGVPTENVIVDNCVVYRAHGGFVIGSEMSGGVRNMWVSNCTFIGTDIGLRFKTTRGRGGIVENIYIDNVHMKDIPGEAVLFDMYYAAQDPIKLAGETRQPPKVETKPVDETTPQLRNFRISNISCNGASKGIFMRGLPEMHVQNVTISNAVLQAQEGLDIQEASGITLSNITMLSKNTNPVAYVLNSDGISINNLKYANGADLLLQVQGERSSNIKVTGTDASKAKEKLKADFGANAQSINWR